MANLKDGVVVGGDLTVSGGLSVAKTVRVAEDIYKNGELFTKEDYPVNSIYLTFGTPLGTNTNPASLFGGVWEPFSAGCALVGYGDTGWSAPDGVNSTGFLQHPLSKNEMPWHYHRSWTTKQGNSRSNLTQDLQIASDVAGDTYDQIEPDAAWSGFTWTDANTGHTHVASTSTPVGGDGLHNNIQPSVVCYMFRRVS